MSEAAGPKTASPRPLHPSRLTMGSPIERTLGLIQRAVPMKLALGGMLSSFQRERAPHRPSMPWPAFALPLASRVGQPFSGPKLSCRGLKPRTSYREVACERMLDQLGTQCGHLRVAQGRLTKHLPPNKHVGMPANQAQD
ncbi:uncharacterized protein VTP21DRAFT_11195 [Calcarisporiella thermophila]|uniref:uncharacterized protein n=1 Tax=Calcarisporiella thermophila TaxID=911321 RepID=UPI0037432C76